MNVHTQAIHDHDFIRFRSYQPRVSIHNEFVAKLPWCIAQDVAIHTPVGLLRFLQSTRRIKSLTFLPTYPIPSACTSRLLSVASLANGRKSKQHHRRRLRI